MTDIRVLAETSPRFRVQPKDIRLAVDGRRGGLGKHELDLSFGRLVHFFKTKGYWSHFTLEELSEHYKAQGWNPNGMLFGLAGLWFNDSPNSECAGGRWEEEGPYLAFSPEGTCAVTEAFALRCEWDRRKS